MDFSGAVPKKSLEITNKSVDISLASSFQDDIFVVVISHGSRHLLIVHLWFILPVSPPGGDLVRIVHLELPSVPSPGYEVLAGLVSQEFQEKLPQLDRATSCEGWS